MQSPIISHSSPGAHQINGSNPNCRGTYTALFPQESMHLNPAMQGGNHTHYVSHIHGGKHQSLHTWETPAGNEGATLQCILL